MGTQVPQSKFKAAHLDNYYVTLIIVDHRSEVDW